MKKLFVILIIPLLLSGCMTYNRIKRNCDKFSQVCMTTKEWTVYRDTTIYVHDTIEVKLPPDTVKIRDTVIVKNGVASMDPIHKQFGLISADAWIYNSMLGINAYLNDSTFLHARNDTVYIPGAITTVTKNNTVKEKYIPKAYKYAFWGWIIVFVAVIAYFGIKYKTFIIGFIKKLI